MISDQLFKTSIAKDLTVVGADPQTSIILLTDGTNRYMLTKNHLDELEKAKKVSFKDGKLVANWRRAGANSEFIRGDEATAAAKVTASDIATRLGI